MFCENNSQNIGLYEYLNRSQQEIVPQKKACRGCGEMFTDEEMEKGLCKEFCVEHYELSKNEK